MAKFCYVNGKIVSTEEAMVSAYDIGLVRGYGIYEALQTVNNKPLFLEDHLKRLRHSSKGMKIQIPVSDEEISSIILELIQRNGYQETNIKMLLTGGPVDGTGIYFNPETPTLVIFAEENKALPAALYEKGCKVITFEHQRLYPEFKTTNYITAVNLQPLKKEKEAFEILYHAGGKILEASTSNFFLVQGDKIVTAKRQVLPGITKLAVLDAVAGKIPVEERDILVQEFGDATEAFLTASYKDVLPVTHIDDHKVGNGEIGPVTKEVMRLFGEYVNKYIEGK